MMRLAVYTCILGPIRDRLWPAPEFSNIDLVAFTDQTTPVPGWTIKPQVAPALGCPRRMARYHKVNPHLVLPEYDDWFWLDGSFQLRDSPTEFLSSFTEDMDLGCFKHSERSCVYAEYRSCVRLRKDDVGIMTDQVARYRKQFYPADNGLTETGILYRRNVPAVKEFNEIWWEEICRGSCRDQLSFDFCLWKKPLKVVRFPGNVYLNSLTTFHRHR